MNTSTSVQKDRPKFRGAQKAAILMMILKEDASAKILKQLDDAEVRRVGREMANMPRVTSEIAEEVLTEFYQMILSGDYVLQGGIEYARKVLTAAFGSDQAGSLIERLTQTLGIDNLNLDALQKADSQQLANIIQHEHPQTIALILSHLAPTQAATLLGYLPVGDRGDIVLRMANLEQISPETIAKIADIVGDRLLALGETDRQTFGGARAVAEMLNQIDLNEGEAILETISSIDPGLSEAIRHSMLIFEDLAKVDPIGIRAILERVDRNVLAIALKGTGEVLKSGFLSVMSRRGAEMMREDMEALGPVKMREVASARQEVLSAVRALEAEGLIILKSSDEEQYVS